jgi:hypothetical protein
MDIKTKQKDIVLIVIGVVCFFLIFEAAQAHAVSPPGDIDHGFSVDEQQGGGGLVVSYDTQDRAINNFCVEGSGVSVNYVSTTEIEVTDAYGTLRTYTLSDMDGRKRVSAVTGIAGAPYSRNNAVRWQYDTEMRLIEMIRERLPLIFRTGITSSGRIIWDTSSGPIW